MSWSDRQPDYPDDPDSMYDPDEIYEFDDPEMWDDDPDLYLEPDDEGYDPDWDHRPDRDDEQGCSRKRDENDLSDTRENLQEHHNRSSHAELESLRSRIAEFFRLENVIFRSAKGASLGAASAGLLSLLIQLLSDDPIDAERVGKDSGKGALLGGSRVLTDAGIYHFAAKVLGIAPEDAVVIAHQGGAAVFCLVAIGSDTWAEIQGARSGDLSSEDGSAQT